MIFYRWKLSSIAVIFIHLTSMNLLLEQEKASDRIHYVCLHQNGFSFPPLQSLSHLLPQGFKNSFLYTKRPVQTKHRKRRTKALNCLFFFFPKMNVLQLRGVNLSWKVKNANPRNKTIGWSDRLNKEKWKEEHKCR